MTNHKDPQEHMKKRLQVRKKCMDEAEDLIEQLTSSYKISLWNNHRELLYKMNHCIKSTKVFCGMYAGMISGKLPHKIHMCHCDWLF